MLKHALGYLELGWSVFPLKPKDKTPLVKWQAYQTKKPTADEVTAWWKKWPDANIGLATGAISGVVVIDIDSAEGREAYTAEFGELHNTIRQTTGKPGGLHLLFAPRNGTKYQNMARTIPFVDVRGDGGYIVVSPSVHPNGTVYQWEHIDPLEMGIDDLLPIPDSVHDVLTREVSEDGKKKKTDENWVNDLLLMGADKGTRNTNAARLAGYYLRVHEGNTDMVEPLLLNWNELRCKPPLSFKEIRTIVKSVSETRKREVLEEASDKFEALTQVNYPDGTIRYQVRLKGYDGYIEMDYATLDSNAKYRIAVNPVIGVCTPPVKRGLWLKIVNALLANRKTITVSMDETKAGAVVEVIRNTIPKTDPAFYKRNIIYDHEHEEVYFKMQTLLDILYAYNSKLDQRLLGKILRDLGFKNPIKKFKGFTFRAWSITKTEWQEKLAGEWPFGNIICENAIQSYEKD